MSLCADSRARGLAGLLVVGIAVVARGVPSISSLPISDVLIAIGLGIAAGQLMRDTSVVSVVRAAAAHSPSLLRIGVVLLGARLSLDAVLTIGAQVLVLVVLTMAAALLLIIHLGRRLGLPADLTILLAVGTAVCGNSAIAAVAPVIRAEPRHVGFAVGTVTLFGTSAVIAYPLIAAFLRMPDAAFGVWAGVAINDTSQVVAASAAYSGPAVLVATVVKLVRNSLMAPLIAAIAWFHRDTESGGSALSTLHQAIPPFVIAFLVLAGLRSASVVSEEVGLTLGTVSSWLIVMAVAGIAAGIRFDEIRTIGAVPFAVGAVSGVLLAAASLIVVYLTGVGS